MFFWQKPTFEQLKNCLWEYQKTEFTYGEVGETHGGKLPAHLPCGRIRVRLGSGRKTYLRAKALLKDWKMFPADFVELIWPTGLEKGKVIATLFRAPGFWTLNPCRIVYTFDEMAERDGKAIEQFGFAYGTVGDHLASGEERFTVEYDHKSEDVWYEIQCFSVPRHWLAKATLPYFRLQQHRFRRRSAAAMQQEIAAST